MNKINFGLIEFGLTIIFGVVGYFLTRTLATYDRRIEQVEDKQDKTLDYIIDIDKKMVKLNTQLKEREKKNG